MKKIFNSFLFTALALLSVVSLAGCSADDEDFAPGEQDAGAYLYTDNASPVYIPTDNQVLAVSVGRTDSTEAGTYSISCDNSKFNCPSTVTFNAGEKTKTLAIPFNMGIGSTEKVTFKIADKDATVYGDSTLTFTVMRDYEWESAGTGELSDQIIYGISGTVQVEHAKGTSIYRIDAPFTALFKQAGESKIPTSDNIQFTYENGKMSIADGFIYPDQTGNVIPYFLYYDATNYAKYCNIVSDGNTFVINLLAGKLSDMTPAYTGYLSFTWDDMPE